MTIIMRAKTEVSVKWFMRLMSILLGVILALKLSSYSMYVIGALVAYTLIQKRVEFAFFSFILLVSLSIMNSVFFEKGAAFYLVTRVSLFLLALVMTIRAGFRRTAWFLSPFLFLYVYMIFMMVASLIGWAPIVSELKALLFLAFMLAIVQNVSALVQAGIDIRIIRSAILVVACFFILGSVASIPFPSIGRSMVFEGAEMWGIADFNIETDGLFNGVTWHSQTLGPVVAMLNAFVLSDYLCNFRRRNFLYLGLLVMAPILVYMSSSRTALFSYLISVVSSLFFFMRERRVTSAKKSQVLLVFVLTAIAGAAFIAVKPNSGEMIESFLRKEKVHDGTEYDESVTESLMKSRKGLIEQGFENFKDSPLIGNGFQVSEDMKDFDFSKGGLVLTAPVEKGVLPVMILEEGGIIGAFLFSTFIVSIYVKYSKLRFTCFLSTFTAMLCLNSGEAAFFSTSGGGGILWMTCFCSLLMDVYRHRRFLLEQQENISVGVGS